MSRSQDHPTLRGLALSSVDTTAPSHYLQLPGKLFGEGDLAT